jgi:ankyrin repeat protein
MIGLLYEHGIDPFSTANDWKNHLDDEEGLEDWEEGHPLSIAASYGHVSVVRLLLKYGLRPDLPTGIYEKRTALHLAAKTGHLDIVCVLADAGSPIDAQDGHGATPLTFAAQEGHLDVVQFLLSRGADPNITTEYQGTSLCMASLSGNINIVRCLLDHGATPNPSYPDGEKPLFQLSRAAEGGYDDIVDLLLTRFDYIKSSTEPYQQAVLLCVAAITGRTTLLTDLLTKHNYDPDLYVTDGRIFLAHKPPYLSPRTALTWAAERNQPAAINILLSHSASITPPTDQSPNNNRTYKDPPALFYAIGKGHKEAVATLLANGADPNNPPGKALSVAVAHPPVFSLLLDHNADPAIPLLKSTLLANILFSGNVETLRILLDHPKGPELVMDPLSVRNGIRTRSIPLFHAALIGGEGVLRLLLDRGLLTPPSELNDRTAQMYLDLAAKQGGVPLMRLLLEIGFDVHAGDNTGELVHRAATAKEDPEGLLDFLLQNGCKIDDTNHIGRTALFLAAYYRDESVMRRLLDRGADPLVGCLGETVLSIAVNEKNVGAVKLILEVFDERQLELSEIEEVLKGAEKNLWEGDRHIGRLLRWFYWRRRYPVSTSDDLSLVS